MNMLCDIHIACNECGECHICSGKICFFIVEETYRKMFNDAIEEHNYMLAHEIERLAYMLDFNLTGE